MPESEPSECSADLFCRSAALVLAGWEIPRTWENRSALPGCFNRSRSFVLNTNLSCSLIRPVCRSGTGTFYFAVIGTSHVAVTYHRLILDKKVQIRVAFLFGAVNAVYSHIGIAAWLLVGWGSHRRDGMSVRGFLATESQLGRSKGDAAITRPSLLKELVERGVRMTAQRRLLVRIIQDSPRHLDAAGLLRIAKRDDAGIDRATVYRTIALLKSRGLIDELDLMHLEGEKHYYEATTNRDHCHIACFRCGAIMEYASRSFQRLKEEIAGRSGFRIQAVRLEVGGVCASCQRAGSS
jgi:Fur family transcriptional regulator, ferric uptake regulator